MNQTALASYSRLTALNGIFEEKYPFMGSTVSKNFAAFGEVWAGEIEQLLAVMLPTIKELSDAVDGYVRFSLDVTRRQARFDEDGGYPDKRFQEVVNEVYLNDKYMESHYLPGLLLSHFLWAHHYRQGLYFAATFLREMIDGGAESFIDAGVGTGFLSRRVLTAMPGITGVGFDISPASKRFAQRQANSFQTGDRYEVKLMDLSANTPKLTTDWLISSEVLEHLEDPTEFLLQLRRMLRPGGKGFITAAINAAEVDHIYLYHHPGEIREQLLEAGFTVEQYHSVSAYKPRKPDLPPPEVVSFIVT
jgi:2-polyprenyl-3-methyl-5-hydroxy-6-metoxy-1,4-benzoquinol methylase